ncbi:MAG: hypothetical protein AAF716_17930 [Cyanobacteria bacterium P01_D01_bin.1]
MTDPATALTVTVIAGVKAATAKLESQTGTKADAETVVDYLKTAIFI